MKGTELYCWEIADNAWKCGALEGTNRNKTFEELKMIQESYPCPFDTMKTILAKFPDKARKEIFVLIIDFPLTSASCRGKTPDFQTSSFLNGELGLIYPFVISYSQ